MRVLAQTSARLLCSRSRFNQDQIKREKMEKLTEVFQGMSEGKMQGRVVLDLQ